MKQSQKTISIVYVIESLERGGAEGLLASIVKKIDKARFSPVVVSLSGKVSLKREIESAGIPVFVLHMKEYTHWLYAVISLWRIIRRKNADIVHTHLFFANIYGRIAAKISGVKQIITTLHNPDYSFDSKDTFFSKVRKALDKFTGIYCNTSFFAVSNFVKKDYEKNLSFRAIEVLYNCAETIPPCTSQDPIYSSKREELGFKKEDRIIVNVGRLYAQKGQIYLLKAVALLKEASFPCKVILIGQGGLEGKLREAAVKLNLENDIIFLRNRIDLVEAMLIGLPVIASDIESIREIVRDRQDGILVEPMNSDALALAIKNIVSDKPLSLLLGESAKLRAHHLFNTERYIRNLENRYLALRQQGGPY